AKALTDLQRPREALADWDRAIALEAAGQRGRLMLERAATLAQLGEHARATREAAKLAANSPKAPAAAFKAACLRARAVRAVRRLGTLPEAEQDRLAEAYAVAAVALLRQCHDAGFFRTRAGREQLESDRTLAPLRERADFARLLATVAADT